MAKIKKIEVPDNLTDAQKKQMINDWFTNGGYKQLEINSVKTCTDYAYYSREDALAYTIAYFLGLDLDKQFKIYCDGAMEHYITRALSLQVKSTTSGFYTHYRKPLIRERELVNERGEEFHGDEDLSDGDELEGRMKCLRYFYDNELNRIDRWLVEQKVFQNKKLNHIAAEFELNPRDVNNQWTALKGRLRRMCKSY